MKPFWKSSNFWTNVLAVLASVFVGNEAQQIIEAGQGVVNSLFDPAGIQIAAVVTAAISFFNILYHLVFKPKTPIEAVVKKILEDEKALPVK